MSPNIFRYVLIPAPSIKTQTATSGLTAPLERARAWYGLNDLSYASVAQRFGLEN